jgi:recombination associated protein RdgC
MFKHLILYRIESTTLPELDAVETAMQQYAFTPCAPTQEGSSGWVPPRGHDNGPLIESVGGQWIMKLLTEQRILPGSVVSRHADDRLDKIEKETGRRPKGKRLREIKEEVRHELLPRAFTRESTMLAWLDPVARLVAIGASSRGRADTMAAQLIQSAPGLNLHALRTALNPGTAMALWLANQEAPAGFSIDRDCELKQPDSEKAAVRYARHTLELPEVGEHIRQGKTPTKLAMSFKGRVSFVLQGNMVLQRLRLLDVVLQDAFDADERAADGFDADVAMFTGEMRLMLPELLSAMGGIEVPPIVAASQPDGDKPAFHAEGDGPDPLFDQAVTVVRSSKHASISLVQRHLQIGYNRAARLLERMEAEGMVSPMDREGKRELLTETAEAAS